jgi:hypothetical protein
VELFGFAQGAFVMHTTDAKLVPEEKAIYDIFSDNDGEGHVAKCGVKAYVWNGSAKAFDLNAHLSRKASRRYCRSLTAGTPYADPRSGISFRYPEGYVLKRGDLGDKDEGLGYLGPIPMAFVGSGGVRIRNG